MSSVTGSSTFSVASHSSNGMSGLVSGMDTDGLVQQMLSGTQAKIDKQEQTKQQLTWKQEIYRKLITDINSLSNKYFAYGATTNLSNTTFFDSMKSSSTSTAFKVTGTSSASTGATSVIVEQLATAAVSDKTKTAEASSQMLKGMFDSKAFDMAHRKVVFEVNGSDKVVDLSSCATIDDAKTLLAEKLGVTVEVNANGAITMTSGASTEVRVSGKSDEYGLQMLGLSPYSTSVKKKDSDGNVTKQVLSASFNAAPEVNFQVSLDGIVTTVKLDAEKIAKHGTTPYGRTEMLDDINKQLEKAYGKLNGGTVMVKAIADAVDSKGYKFVVAPDSSGNPTQDGHLLQVAGEGVSMSMTGLVSNQSSNIGVNIALKDVSFKEGLIGSEFKFDINGTQFAFNSNDTVYSVMKKINNSGAGVRMTYSALDDKFSIESTATGSGERITIKQTEGNLLSSMFGSANIAGADKASSDLIGKDLLSGDPASSFPTGFSGGTLKMKVNGREYTYSFPQLKEGSTYDEDDVLDSINRSMQQQFGYVGNDTSDRKQAIELERSSSGGFEIRVNNTAAVSFDAPATGEDTTQNLASLLGLSGRNNFIGPDDGGVVHMSELEGHRGIDATDVTALEGLVTKGVISLQMVDSKSTGRFNLNSTDTDYVGMSSAEKTAISKLFGVDFGGTGGSVMGDGNIVIGRDFISAGHNAVVDINGVKTERSSNNFTVNGLNFELKGVSKKAADGITFIEDTVTTERDTDTIFEGLKTFVEDYNKLVETLNTYVREDPYYKSYPPLTAAQKKEMSDREVEQWEEKAKQGLLRNDNDVSMLLSGMRLALFQKPTDAKYGLYDLGIDTVSGYSDGKKQGTLKLDEATLKKMIASDPESIRQLFTDSDKGISAVMKKAIDAAAKVSSGTAGTLVQMAGMSGYATDKNNTLTNRITEIKDKIKDLNAKYEKERQKYWNQFNQMEQLIQQMNSQSSWLGQSFA